MRLDEMDIPLERDVFLALSRSGALRRSSRFLGIKKLRDLSALSEDPSANG
jgi:hypothetical protein